MTTLFADGDAVFRIGLRPIPLATWLEGGEVDAARKDDLLVSNPRDVWGELDGSRPGQAEAATLLDDHFGSRVIDGQGGETAPLWAASLRVADDLCLMELRDGRWTLTAASLCSPSFFTAEHAVGLDLSRLHAPVPGFEAALLARVARIFDALRPDVILERRNWSLVPSAALFTPDPVPLRTAWEALHPEDALGALHLRRERQTLRRLPRTGGMLFTIRIHRHPLAALADDAPGRRAFASAWADVMSPIGEPFRRYKGLARFDPIVRAFLAKCSDASP